VGERRERKERVKELLDVVGLGPRFLDHYPHEFSGGQRQRIGIARALALKPKFIVCDEPVSALDVSVQSQILNLLGDLQESYGLTYLFISHNLNVVNHISHRVGVMYLGRIVEIAGSADLYRNPLHPYTRGLLGSILIPDPDAGELREALAGEITGALEESNGCRFLSRCSERKKGVCEGEAPPLKEVKPGHQVACWMA
jgi:oligopeptide/dipeptide ABC transporter ATP-binding protein